MICFRFCHNCVAQPKAKAHDKSVCEKVNNKIGRKFVIGADLRSTTKRWPNTIVN